MKHRLFRSHGILGAIIGLLGSLIFFRNYLLAPGWQWLVADDFDSRLLTWIFEWGYHSLFILGKPLSFFQANSFYPHSESLAYSDSLLSAQIFFAPFRLIGIPTIPAVYAALTTLTVCATFLTERGLSRLSLNAYEKILIIWVAHFGLSISSFMGHYQLFGFQLAAPFFIYLYLYLNSLSPKDALMLGGILVVGILFSMYLAPMLFVVGFFCTLPFIPKIFSRIFSESETLKNVLIGGLILSFAAALLYFIQLKVYFDIAKVLPKQSLLETSHYSGRVLSIIRGFPLSSYWYAPSGYEVNGDWERAYFPGCILLVSITTLCALTVSQILGGLVIIKDGITQTKDSPLSFCSFCFIIFFSSLILSWGPFIGTDPTRRLPFFYLSEIFPGLSSVRAPGRFGMFIGLPLSVFLVVLLRNWERLPIRRNFLSFVFSLAVIIETLPTIPIFKIPYGDDSLYGAVKDCINEGEPMIELPVAAGGHLDTLKLVMAQLNGSTHHWAKMVIGYGSRTTPELSELIGIDQQIQQSNNEGQEKLVSFAKKLGIRKILIRTDRTHKAEYSNLLLTLSAHGEVAMCSPKSDSLSIVSLK